MAEVSLLFDSRLFVFIRGSLLVVCEALFKVQVEAAGFFMMLLRSRRARR